MRRRHSDRQIVVNVRDLDDTVTLTTGLTSLIAGQDGNDTLNGGDGHDMLAAATATTS